MNTKRVWSVFLLAFGFVALFILNRAWQANKNLVDLPQNNNEVVETPNVYKRSSAISKVKEQSSQNQRYVFLREEASQFGINLMLWEEDRYRKIRDRLFVNNNLALTLRTVNQEGIFIALENKFQVNFGVIDINIDATDDEIIKFLVDSLPVAKARKASFEGFRKEASQFGLHLMSWEEDAYKQIRNRLLINDQLALALKTAKSEGIPIGLGHEFRILADTVDINVDASDKEIIQFLLGK